MMKGLDPRLLHSGPASSQHFKMDYIVNPTLSPRKAYVLPSLIPSKKLTWFLPPLFNPHNDSLRYVDSERVGWVEIPHWIARQSQEVNLQWFPH